jgi:hypothetical protein
MCHTYTMWFHWMALSNNKNQKKIILFKFELFTHNNNFPHHNHNNKKLFYDYEDQWMPVLLSLY